MIPALLSGLGVTLRHFFRRKVTMEYPEERWKVPPGYRGAPYLVRDQEGNIKCVACQLCEFVCPPKAIRVTPPGPDGPVPDRPNAEKMPVQFEIDMLRCIFCGLCQEVCPEDAIRLMQDYSFVGTAREQLRLDRDELLRRGGRVYDPIQKWKRKAQEAAEQGVEVPGWPEKPQARKGDPAASISPTQQEDAS